MASVTVEIVCDSPRVSRARLREFLTDALQSWGGELHPDDPLFGSLRVKNIRFVENSGKEAA